jgi:hypothetical protein
LLLARGPPTRFTRVGQKRVGQLGRTINGG